MISNKKNNSLEWINIQNPSLKKLKKIQGTYDLKDIDINDCLALTHRSKIDHYDDYTFAIFLYPIFIKETREIAAQEIDFWIGQNFLISAHRNNHNPVSELFDEYQKNTAVKKEFSKLSSERLLYEIHLKFVNYLMPMMKHLDADLDNIEKMIFAGYEKKMVREISIIRRNITDYRKIVEPHKNILIKLMRGFQQSKIYSMKANDVYYENLIDYAQEIWNALEGFKERIEALQETNESLISFKLNDTMNLLAVVSLITLPASLIAAIFGTNMNDHPITNFWTLISVMLVVMLFSSIIWFVRTRKLK